MRRESVFAFLAFLISSAVAVVADTLAIVAAVGVARADSHGRWDTPKYGSPAFVKALITMAAVNFVVWTVLAYALIRLVVAVLSKARLARR